MLAGVYTGIGNRNIDTKGKAIKILGKNGPQECIINCEDSGQGFYIHSGEDSNTIIEGLTITDGNAPLINDNIPRGGGILCENSSPTIKNCIITDCNAFFPEQIGEFWIVYYGQGGGICYTGASYPHILDCNISFNTSCEDGGGIYCQDG